MKILNIIKLMRPEQWLKNVFIFLPLFFSGNLLDISGWEKSIIAFLSFSFLASSVYCLNDILDIENDRSHPEKCKRPIASGHVTKKEGYLLMVILWVVSFLLLQLLDQSTRWIAAGIMGVYYVLNIAYCFKLKHIVILDVFIIAIGFVIRILIGGVVTGIVLSHWIVLMGFLLALFLGFGKRRDDVVIFNETGVKVRKGVSKYNLPFLNQVLTIVATMTVVCYIMYTVSEEVISRFDNQYLYLTSVFVLAGMIRYLQIALVVSKDVRPTRILMHDLFIQICIVCWILSFFFIIYC